MAEISSPLNNPGRPPSAFTIIMADRGWLLCLVLISSMVGMTALLFLLIPKDFEFRVVNASLSQFSLTNNNSTLDFNLSLVINVTNPNEKGELYNNLVEARAFYEDKQFGSLELIPFNQGHKNTTIIRPIFHGQASVHFGKSESSAFNRDQSNGSFDIKVKLYGYRYVLVEVVYCDLKQVPLVSNGSVLASSFQTTDCEFTRLPMPYHPR